MNDDTIDAGRLRREVQVKYRDVALRPGRAFNFRIGRPLAEFLGYPRTVIAAPALSFFTRAEAIALHCSGVHHVRLEPVVLQQLQQPPPAERGLDRGRRAYGWGCG
jgi:hypothetical protein